MVCYVLMSQWSSTFHTSGPEGQVVCSLFVKASARPCSTKVSHSNPVDAYLVNIIVVLFQCIQSSLSTPPHRSESFQYRVVMLRPITQRPTRCWPFRFRRC